MEHTRRLVALASAALLALTLIAAPAAAASDSKIAKKGVIVTSDMPATWTQSPRSEPNEKEFDKIAASIPSCKKYRAFVKAYNKIPNAKSADFEFSDQTINNESYVFSSTGRAKKAFKQLRAAEADVCLTDFYQKVLTDELSADPQTAAKVQGTRVQVNPVTNFSNLGDDSLGFVGGSEIALTDGSSIQTFLGYGLIRIGRAINSYEVTAPPTSNDFQPALEGAIKATVDRTEQALG